MDSIRDYIEKDRSTNPRSYKPIIKLLGLVGNTQENRRKARDAILESFKDCSKVIKSFKSCFSYYPKKRPKPKKQPKIKKAVVIEKIKTIRKRKVHGEYVVIGGQYEHRVIYNNKVGEIPNGWHIHHIDENKSNNDISNLIALPHQVHYTIHKLMWHYKKSFTKQDLENKLQIYLDFMNAFSGTPLTDIISKISLEELK